MTPRRDLLAECNTANEGLPTFQETWCKRCTQPDCTRSSFGLTRFDVRTRTWEDRLFINPPRMDPSDPRFALLNRPHFLSVDVGPTPELRSWVDPASQTAPVEAPVVVKKDEPPVLTAVLTDPPPVAQETAAPAPVPTPAPVQRPTEADPNLAVLSMQTPNQTGAMIVGVRSANPPPSATPKDPWAAPTPAENVVPVGGRVKLGV